MDQSEKIKLRLTALNHAVQITAELPKNSGAFTNGMYDQSYRGKYLPDILSGADKLYEWLTKESQNQDQATEPSDLRNK